MRKIIAIVSLALGSIVGAQAQSDKPNLRLEAGIGMSDSWYSSRHFHGKTGNFMSSNEGLAARFGLTTELILTGDNGHGLFFAPGLEYRYSSYRFSKVSSVNGEDVYSSTTGATHRLYVPLGVGYRVKVSERRAISFGGGIYAAYGLAASQGLYKGEFKRFEGGVQTSVAYEFARYSFRFGFNYSLTDVSDVPDTKFFGSDYFLSFGIRL